MDPDRSTRARALFGKRERTWLLKINSENLLKNIGQVSANAIIVAIIMLVFNLVLSRKLGPAQYGELQTLLSINAMIAISFAAVGFIVAKFVSYYRTRQQYDHMRFLANWAFIFFCIVGMAAFFITVILSKILAAFLNITEYRTVIIFGFLVWISFLTPIIDGILRGLQEFTLIGRYRILDAILKTILACVLAYLGFTVEPIIVGIVIGSMLALSYSAYRLKKEYINRPSAINMKEIYQSITPMFFALALYAVLSFADIILVKHFFDATTTGYFAAAGMLAKIVLGISFGSAGVMFPKVIAQYSNGNIKQAIQTFRNTLKITLIAGGICTIVLAIFPSWIGHVLFGSQYAIGELLSVYAFAMFFLSLASVMLLYDLAIKRYMFIGAFLAAAIIEIHQIIIAHASLMAIAWTLFIVNGALLVFMTVYNRKALFEK